MHNTIRKETKLLAARLWVPKFESKKGQNIFPSITASIPKFGSQNLNQRLPEEVFPETRQLRPEDNHPRPSSVNNKNPWIYTSISPYVLMAERLISKLRDKFTFCIPFQPLINFFHTFHYFISFEIQAHKVYCVMRKLSPSCIILSW